MSGLCDSPAVVFDNGSHTVKAGFEGEDAPKSVVPTVVGYHRNTENEISKEKWFVGKEISMMEGKRTLRYPVERGIIVDWDEMERVGVISFRQDLIIIS